MPVNARSKTRIKSFFVRLSSKSMVELLLLLGLCSLGTILCGQTLEIKLVNGKSGSPIANGYVNTWVGTQRKDAMAIPTDKDGVAWLYLTDKDAEVNSQSQPRTRGNFGVVHPVVKYGILSVLLLVM